MALAFHAREHGASSSRAYVLVQGRATVDAAPTPARKQQVFDHAARYLGTTPRNRFWDFWLREYGDVRVPVDVAVERIVVWPDLRCAGEPVVDGAPLPEPPPPQAAPKKGTGPRIDIARAARRLGKTDHLLLSWRGGDGFPVVLPVTLAAAAGRPADHRRRALRIGARRAGLLGHAYRPKLVGLLTRARTPAGSTAALYAPHTEAGYQAPPNKTLLLLLNGALAKHGVRKARKAGKL